jgi:hypothetical protein
MRNRGKPGTDGTFPSFLLNLRDKCESGLMGISRALFGASSLSSSQGSPRLGFQGRHEFRTSQRSAVMRKLAQWVQVVGSFRRGEKGTPFRHRPTLSPALYCEDWVRVGKPAVGGSAGPLPMFLRRHHAGAYRVQLRIAERLPQVSSAPLPVPSCAIPCTRLLLSK